MILRTCHSSQRVTNGQDAAYPHVPQFVRGQDMNERQSYSVTQIEQNRVSVLAAIHDTQKPSFRWQLNKRLIDLTLEI